MKTPTLIVRLVGLYLVVQSSGALIQINKVKAMTGGMGATQNAIMGDIWIYAVLGLILGLAATVFAGVLARVLTFDAGRE